MTAIQNGGIGYVTLATERQVTRHTADRSTSDISASISEQGESRDIHPQSPGMSRRQGRGMGWFRGVHRPVCASGKCRHPVRGVSGGCGGGGRGGGVERGVGCLGACTDPFARLESAVIQYVVYLAGAGGGGGGEGRGVFRSMHRPVCASGTCRPPVCGVSSSRPSSCASSAPR